MRFFRLLTLLLCCSANAAHVRFTLQNFTTVAITNKPVKITFLSAAAASGGAIIGHQVIQTNSGATGVFIVSNMVAGVYRVDVLGDLTIPGPSTFQLTIPDTNALIEAYLYLSATAISTTYTTTASDARFVGKTNSWSTGQVLTNATFRGSTNAFTFTNGVSAGQFLSTDGTNWFPVTVSPGGGGEVNTSSNTGDGVGIAAPKSTYDLPIKSFKSANGMATWATNGTNITLTIDLTSTTNAFARTTELNSASNHLELVKQPASANLTNWSGVSTQTFARITDLDNASNHLELVKQPASSTLTNLSNTGAITNVSDAGNAFISLIYTSNNFTIKLATFQAGANVWVTNNGTNLVIAGHSTNGLSRMLSFDANQFSVVNGTNIVMKSGVLLTNVNTFGLTNQGPVNFSGTFTNFGDQKALGAIVASGTVSSDTLLSSAGGIQSAGDIVSSGGNISSDIGFGSFLTALYVGDNFEINGVSGDFVKVNGVTVSFPAANAEGFLLNNGSGTYGISSLPLTNTINDGIGSGQIAITNGVASQKGKFKSLSAGSNVTLTDQGTNILIAASASSGTSTGYVFNANQFGFVSVSNISIASGVLLTNVQIYNTAAAVAKIINAAASSATNISEIWSNGVMMQNVDSNGWTRIYTRNTNAAPQWGLTMVNSNAQNQSGIPVYSPGLRMRGYGRKTSVTAGDQPVDWGIYNQPVDASAAPTANLLFGYAVNDGSFTTEFTFGSAGTFTAVGTVTGSPLTSGNIVNASSSGAFRWNTATVNAPQIARGTGANAASILVQGGENNFYPSNNIIMGGQLTGTNILNGGWTEMDLPATNKSSVNFPTNNASFNTIAPSGQNNIALGKGWTNNLGARADMVISVKYVDAATGDPALAFTNTITGEAWTNNVAFGITATYTELLVIPDISPSDYGSFTDLSGTGASITFMKAWWKLK